MEWVIFELLFWVQSMQYSNWDVFLQGQWNSQIDCHWNYPRAKCYHFLNMVILVEIRGAPLLQNTTPSPLPLQYSPSTPPPLPLHSPSTPPSKNSLALILVQGTPPLPLPLIMGPLHPSLPEWCTSGWNDFCNSDIDSFCTLMLFPKKLFKNRRSLVWIPLLNSNKMNIIRSWSRSTKFKLLWIFSNHHIQSLMSVQENIYKASTWYIDICFKVF